MTAKLRDGGARFEIVRTPAELERLGDVLTIRDLGPWDQHFTITNDAEDVVAKLLLSYDLKPGRRLFYYDSEGDLDEITWDLVHGFTGFGPLVLGLPA